MDKLSGFIAKLKNIKNVEILLGGAALVAVLLIYFTFVSCSGGDDKQTSGDIDISSADYCTSMQAQVESIVSKLAGVGNAEVVINWDKSVSSVFGGSSGENPHALGALIVCDGGDSTKVKLDVIYAVSTLLDLSIEKIIVYPKSNL